MEILFALIAFIGGLAIAVYRRFKKDRPSGEAPRQPETIGTNTDEERLGLGATVQPEHDDPAPRDPLGAAYDSLAHDNTDPDDDALRSERAKHLARARLRAGTTRRDRADSRDGEGTGDHDDGAR